MTALHHGQINNDQIGQTNDDQINNNNNNNNNNKWCLYRNSQAYI